MLLGVSVPEVTVIRSALNFMLAPHPGHFPSKTKGQLPPNLAAFARTPINRNDGVPAPVPAVSIRTDQHGSTPVIRIGGPGLIMDHNLSDPPDGSDWQMRIHGFGLLHLLHGSQGN